MTYSTLANREHIEELLFNRNDIQSVDIARETKIAYVTIAKYRTKERDYMGINLDYAIKLTDAYKKLK